MLLSVITTVYNQEQYVSQTIESVLNQKTDFDFEYIIADDASTDGSADVIQQYADKYSNIIFLRNPENLGAIRNYAQCLKLARGKYLADLGGDDYWIDKHKSQVQIDFLELNKEVGMVYTQFDTVNANNGQIRKCVMNKDHFLSGHLFDNIISLNTNINIGTACFRREAVISLIEKFENEVFKFEDLPFWLELSKHYEIVFLSQSTLCYRLNEESISHSNNYEKQLEYIQNIEEVVRYFLPKDKVLPIDFWDVINVRYFTASLKDKKLRSEYYSKIINKGPIIRLLNIMPFDFIKDLHSFYLEFKRGFVF